jgi:hypothetical protein
MKKFIALAVLGLFTACAALNSPAADKPADKPATPEKGDKKLDKAEKKAARPLPFHGKVTAVDKNTKVLTVGERKFQATSSTKIVKAGKPAILTDANAGDEVGGSYREVDGGKLELVSLRIGPKPAEDKK